MRSNLSGDYAGVLAAYVRKALEIYLEMCLELWMCFELLPWNMSLIEFLLRRSLQKNRKLSTWAWPKELSKTRALHFWHNAVCLPSMANPSRGRQGRFSAGRMTALSPQRQLSASLEVKYWWMYLETTQNLINLILQPSMSLFTTAKWRWIAEGLKMHYRRRLMAVHSALNSIVLFRVVITWTLILVMTQDTCAKLSLLHFPWHRQSVVRPSASVVLKSRSYLARKTRDRALSSWKC